jgi:lipopolysaccharide transport protein LptA/LPS export ABC transporter protein LptC
MNTGVLHIGDAGERELPRILTKEEQRRAFGRARRHTLLVKALRLLLPAASLAIAGLYLLPDGKVVLKNPLPVAVESVDLSTKGLKMINPSYIGGDDKIGRYRVAAEYALQQVKAVHILDMHSITAHIDHPDKKWTQLSATQGTYDTKTEKMTLDGAIDISSNRGMAARLQHADVDVKQQLVTTDRPVTMSYGENAISADTMRLWVKEKRALFNGAVQLRLLARASPGLGEGTGGTGGAGKEPIDIAARSLEIVDAEKQALFSDDIKARQGKYTLTSGTLRVEYQGDIERAEATAQSNTVKAIEAIDNVVLASDDNQRITGDRARFDALRKVITVTGDVVFKQDGNELRGETLTFDMETKHLHLDPATGGGKAKRQRISGTFQPKQSTKPGKRKLQPAGETPAAGGDTSAAGGFATFKMSDSKQPVSIEADSLDVIDAKRHAVFDGNVIVRQDKFEIISKQMVVAYTGGIGQQAGKPPAKGAQSSIKTIDATGKVAISTPDNQTATSDRAVFDVASNIATISGNVVLSQGGNVMHGDKLIIDLNTGRTRFDATATTEGGDAQHKRPRIGAVFIPSKLREQAKQQKAATAAKAEGMAAGDGETADAASGGTAGSKAAGDSKKTAPPAAAISTGEAASADMAPPLPWQSKDAMGGEN